MSKLEKLGTIFLLAILTVAASTAAWALNYDFENGTDGAAVPDTGGLVFEISHGYDWVFGDWRTNKYNGKYPVKSYFSNGHFFAWMGSLENTGRISFTNPVAQFAIKYSSADPVMMQGYSRWGILLDTDVGAPNLKTGTMGMLNVQSASSNIAYVIIGGGSWANYWIIDDISTGCVANSECDDGEYCNGQETCEDGQCVDGTPVNCADDGLYCNGVEYCDEPSNSCKHQNAPSCPNDNLFCNGQEYCNELTDQCGHRNAPNCSDDGKFCNGEEYCNEITDQCGHRNTPVCADDAVFCNGEEFCDDQAGSCNHRNAPDCPQDGSYCNGEEYCDETLKACSVQNIPACSDDGKYCNGEEFCDENSQSCNHKNAPTCQDDGVFCNGEEKCEEATKVCVSSGDPCTGDTFCDEEQGRCTFDAGENDDTAAPDDEEEGWPKGKVSGGCCG